MPFDSFDPLPLPDFLKDFKAPYNLANAVHFPHLHLLLLPLPFILEQGHRFKTLQALKNNGSFANESQFSGVVNRFLDSLFHSHTLATGLSLSVFDKSLETFEHSTSTQIESASIVWEDHFDMRTVFMDSEEWYNIPAVKALRRRDEAKKAEAAFEASATKITDEENAYATQASPFIKSFSSFPLSHRDGRRYSFTKRRRWLPCDRRILL